MSSEQLRRREDEQGTSAALPAATLHHIARYNIDIASSCLLRDGVLIFMTLLLTYLIMMMHH
jgi:hypothetical protein